MTGKHQLRKKWRDWVAGKESDPNQQPDIPPFIVEEHSCHNCHLRTEVVAGVQLGFELTSWCKGCVEVFLKKDPRQTFALLPETCGRCGAETDYRVGVVWGDIDQFWCEECFWEVYNVQMRRGNCERRPL